MTNEMTWEQKLAALKALAPTHLAMRKPGNWYVDTTVRISGADLSFGSYGNGKTPEEAVNAHWNIYTNIPSDRFVIVRGKKFRWNGFMWAKYD